MIRSQLEVAEFSFAAVASPGLTVSSMSEPAQPLAQLPLARFQRSDSCESTGSSLLLSLTGTSFSGTSTRSTAASTLYTPPERSSVDRDSYSFDSYCGGSDRVSFGTLTASPRTSLSAIPRDTPLTRSTRAWWEVFGDDYDEVPPSVSRRASLDATSNEPTDAQPARTETVMEVEDDSGAHLAPPVEVGQQRRTLVEFIFGLFNKREEESCETIFGFFDASKRSSIRSCDVQGVVRVPAEALLDPDEHCLAGWLTKKSTSFPWGSCRRYFVFSSWGCRLSYFESEEEGAAPKDAVVVEQVSMISSEPFGLAFQLVEEGCGRDETELVVRAADADEQMQWFLHVTGALRASAVATAAGAPWRVVSRA